MKRVLISIIVPIYNAEKYLPACLDSILRNTFTDFELLLINDASNDNSLVICNQYAKKDNRIIVFNNGKNGGECVSRNAGIDNARGQYIVCIDADDEVLENHLESLNYCLNIPTGTLVHAPHFISKNDTIINSNVNHTPYFIENLQNNNNNKFDFLFAGPAWSKMMETDIIRNNKIRFRPGVKINGDHIFHLEYLMFMNSYKNVGKKSLIYFDRLESISKKHFSFEECFERVNLLFPLTKAVLERFNILEEVIKTQLYFTPINALISSIIALYRIPFKKEKKDRINCLKVVFTNYGNDLNKYWYPTNFSERVLKQILKLNNYYLLDCCLSMIVFIRYSLLNIFKN
jgi:glycosyltransferase involved in cell wall biosynthesis